MELDEKIKGVIINHKQKIELMQWAIMSSVSSLIYSEYIRCIKNKYTPIFKIHIPAIKTVADILSIDGKFMSMLRENFLDLVANHQLIKKFSNAPELIMLSDDNIDSMKIIFDNYMIPNIVRRIPETISKKFDIGNPKQTLMIEDSHIEMFKSIEITDTNIMNFIVEEFVLQLLTTIPTMKKSLEFPESNVEIYMDDNQIMSIGNDKAICPIQINDKIINNEYMNKLLTFVTSTDIRACEDNTMWKERTGEKNVVDYVISTNSFNQVCLISLDGIELNSVTDNEEK